MKIGEQVIIAIYRIIGLVQHLFGAVVICIANPPFTKCLPKQVLSIIKLFRRPAKTYLFIRKIFICRKKGFQTACICPGRPVPIGIGYFICLCDKSVSSRFFLEGTARAGILSFRLFLGKSARARNNRAEREAYESRQMPPFRRSVPAVRQPFRLPPLRLSVRQSVTARLPLRPQRMRLRRQSRRRKPHAARSRNQNR